MKKVMYLLFLIPFIFSSCSKDETTGVDLRDDYVGTWNEDASGSLSLLQNTTVAFTMPVSQSETGIKITKSGTNQLIIDGLVTTVSGNDLIIASSTDTQTDNGLTMTVTAKYTGTVSKNLITIKESYSGSWSSAGMSGTISGSTMYTFTR